VIGTFNLSDAGSVRPRPRCFDGKHYSFGPTVAEADFLDPLDSAYN
jgi:hypothetical protein